MGQLHLRMSVRSRYLHLLVRTVDLTGFSDSLAHVPIQNFANFA